MPEAKAVQSMFAGIAGKYDAANRLLSGGIDIYWRYRLVRAVVRQRPQFIADLATGSGDVAFALHSKLPDLARITALDFCQPMLDQAQIKQQQRAIAADRLSFAFGDCLALPLPDASMDAVTIAFGLRNLEDRHGGLCEMRRILRPGGHLFVLEFTQPERWFRPVYYLYLKSVLPVLAWALCRNRSAYDYLAGSIEDFPSKESLSHELEAAGFEPVCATGLHASIVALHRGMKPICESRT